MQPIRHLWQTRLGKLAIFGSGVAWLIGLCFVCAMCSVLAGSNDKTQDTASRSNEAAIETLETRPVEPSEREITPIPTEPRPTSTATALSATEIPLPTATITLPIENFPTATSKPVVLAGNSNINLRSGPGTAYDAIGVLTAGDTLDIVGRNVDSSWWQVATPAGLAWLAADVVTANNIDEIIPVVDVSPPIMPSTPTPLPTSTDIPPIEPQLPVVSNETEGISSAGESNGTPFECIGGCAVAPDPSCDIKGNVNSKGEKIYHSPGGQFYDRTDIKPEEGDSWFCSAIEAKNAGFRASER
ncbi:MAG: SH3 domain-containing protein [Anaerolineae bacterium]|nr:SH3 domain-containing protein [Anaerolineae bacterium]